MDDVVSLLAAGFGALEDVYLENLKYHVDVNTPISCDQRRWVVDGIC